MTPCQALRRSADVRHSTTNQHHPDVLPHGRHLGGSRYHSLDATPSARDSRYIPVAPRRYWLPGNLRE